MRDDTTTIYSPEQPTCAILDLDPSESVPYGGSTSFVATSHPDVMPSSGYIRTRSWQEQYDPTAQIPQGNFQVPQGYKSSVVPSVEQPRHRDEHGGPSGQTSPYNWPLPSPPNYPAYSSPLLPPASSTDLRSYQSQSKVAEMDERSLVTGSSHGPTRVESWNSANHHFSQDSNSGALYLHPSPLLSYPSNFANIYGSPSPDENLAYYSDYAARLDRFGSAIERKEDDKY